MAVLAINIGATNTRVAVLEGDKILEGVTFATDPESYAHTLDQILAMTTMLINSGHTITAIGTCVAGNVRSGIVLDGGNLSGDWRGARLADDLGSKLILPVAVLNDAEAEGLGEFTTNPEGLVYVGWGTGIGVSVVRPRFSGLVTQATELGHMTIAMDSSLICGCGGRGHLEAFIGGANLAQRFGHSSVPELTDDEWEQTLYELAIGCTNIALGQSDLPLPLIIGGGVACKQLNDQRLAVLRGFLTLNKTTLKPPTVKLAYYGENSGLIGAAYVASQLSA